MKLNKKAMLSCIIAVMLIIGCVSIVAYAAAADNVEANAEIYGPEAYPLNNNPDMLYEDNAAAFVSNDEVTPEFFTMDELVDVEAVEAAGGEIISSTYTTYNQFLSNLSMSNGKRSQVGDNRIVLAVEIYYPNGFDHVKVGLIQNCVAISLFDAETGDFLGAEYNSVDGDYTP